MAFSNYYYAYLIIVVPDEYQIDKFYNKEPIILKGKQLTLAVHITLVARDVATWTTFSMHANVIPITTYSRKIG